MTESAQVIKFPEPIQEKEQAVEQEYVKADVDNGYFRLANELGLALCKVRLSDRESRLIHAVMLKTFGFNKSLDWICNDQITELTGIGQSHISEIKRVLVARKILLIDGKKLGINPVISEWMLVKGCANYPKPGKNKTTQNRVKKHPIPVSDSPEPGRKTPQNGSHKRQDNNTKDKTLGETSSPGDRSTLKTPSKKSQANAHLKILAPEIVELFNASFDNLSSVFKLTDKRKNKLLKLLKDKHYDADGCLIDFTQLDAWRALFEFMRHSDLLMGRSSDWQCSFDWLMNPDNFIKVLEGNYVNK